MKDDETMRLPRNCSRRGSISVAVILGALFGGVQSVQLTLALTKFGSISRVGGCVLGNANPLLGRSVRIIENEPLIALVLHDALHKAGASI